jgi:hypothetical protein
MSPTMYEAGIVGKGIQVIVREENFTKRRGKPSSGRRRRRKVRLG